MCIRDRYHLTHSLVRLMAPILSFTAEEAWAVLCGSEDESVFTGEWHALPAKSQEKVGMADWQAITAWRARVNKQLEEARIAGLIGSALAAEVDVYAAGQDYETLARLGDDLRFVFITSRATVHRTATEAEQHIDVSASLHDKCERCWHYREDVGGDADHPAICGRCVSNLSGDGERRQYA